MKSQELNEISSPQRGEVGKVCRRVADAARRRGGKARSRDPGEGDRALNNGLAPLTRNARAKRVYSDLSPQERGEARLRPIERNML
jgi:hypothetical protein